MMVQYCKKLFNYQCSERETTTANIGFGWDVLEFESELCVSGVMQLSLLKANLCTCNDNVYQNMVQDAYTALIILGVVFKKILILVQVCTT